MYLVQILCGLLNLAVEVEVAFALGVDCCSKILC